jgi:hypothetical protein
MDQECIYVKRKCIVFIILTSMRYIACQNTLDFRQLLGYVYTKPPVR